MDDDYTNDYNKKLLNKENLYNNINLNDSFDEEKKPEYGRKKIDIKFIKDKTKRSVTFSKRKKGIMKKCYELSVLTGCDILLLVANENGHIYTFATPKLKPVITTHEQFIQHCLGQENTNPYCPDDDRTFYNE